MAQLCQTCSNGKMFPIEMEDIGGGTRSTIYRCPMCSGLREVVGLWGGGQEVRPITTEAANRQIRKGTAALAVMLLGITALGEFCKSQNEKKIRP